MSSIDSSAEALEINNATKYEAPHELGENIDTVHVDSSEKLESAYLDKTDDFTKNLSNFLSQNNLAVYDNLSTTSDATSSTRSPSKRHSYSHKFVKKENDLFLTQGINVYPDKSFNGLNGCCSYGIVNRSKSILLQKLSKAFGLYAGFVFDHTWTVILLSLLISLSLGFGLLTRQSESEMYKLYSRPDTPSQKTKENFLKVFVPERITYILIAGKENRLGGSIINHLKLLDSEIQNIVVQRDNVKLDEFGNPLKKLETNNPPFRNSITFEDVCVRDSWGDCQTFSVLNLYYSKSNWGRTIALREWPIYSNIRVPKAYRIDSILGNMTVEKKSLGGSPMYYVVNATAFSMRYDLTGADELRHLSAAFELEMEKVVNDFKIPGMNITIKTERSINDELARSCTMELKDMIRLFAAILLVLVYTVISSTSLTYRTKSFPGLMGVMAALLGYASGAGVLHFLGIVHTPPAEATPFLVLGIGVDDVFVILNCYAISYPIICPRQRIIVALREASISITITTFTNIIAFVIGAVSPYFSISMFCITTASCLFMGYLMCLTFFLGFLCIDARREANKIPYLWCTLKHSKLCCYCSTKQRFELKDALDIHKDCVNNNANSEICSKKTNIFVESNDHSCTSSYNSTKNDIDIESLQSYSFNDVSNNPIKHSCNDCSQMPQHFDTYEMVSYLLLYEMRSITLKNKKLVAIEKKRNSIANEIKSEIIQSTVPDSLAEGMKNNIDESIASENIHNISDITYGVPTKHQEENNLFCDHLHLNDFYSKEIAPSNISTTQKCNPDALVENSSDANSEDVMITILPHEKRLVSYLVSSPANTLAAIRRNSKNSISGEKTSLQSLSYKKSKGFIGLKKSFLNCLYEFFKFPSLDVKESSIPLDYKNVKEPNGNVGMHMRFFFLKYYGRYLTYWPVKAFVFLLFFAYIGTSIYGIHHLKSGLSVRDITPDHSYLRNFYDIREFYFKSYGEEVTIFFPNEERWEKQELQRLVLELHDRINDSDYSVFIVNGLVEFIRDNQEILQDGNSTNFINTLQDWLSNDPKGKHFKYCFKFDSSNTKLLAWKFYYWMPYIDNTRLLYDWLQEIKSILSTMRPFFHGEAYTPLSVMWESDPKILQYTVTNLLIALIAILVVTATLIPDILSAVLVMCIVILVDLGLFGYMTFFGLELNMLTMVTLLISIGYSVDYTAHMVHTFAHCVGPTRQHRMIETLVVMGNPITHGMISTLLAVLLLANADKYVLVVFFQMMTLVLLFAFGNGVILLPVLLSLFGPMPKRCNTQAPHVENSVSSPFDKDIQPAM